MRPSILAATAIHFGLESTQRMTPRIFDSYTMTLKDFEEEVEFIKKCWRDLILCLLSELPDYLEISSAAKELQERLAYICQVHGKKMQTIYCTRVA